MIEVQADAAPLDVLILGAGPVGMTLARALGGSSCRSGQRLRVGLLDAAPLGQWAHDPRVLALSYGTRQLLESLGCWAGNQATAIADIHISQAGGLGRAQLTAPELGVPHLGYVQRYHHLAAALAQGLSGDLALPLIDVARVTALTPLQTPAGVTVAYQRHGRAHALTARLVVHAEGSPVDDPAVKSWDYGQHAVLAEVSTRSGHQHRAWERFTPAGPVALLPLESGYAVVYTVPPARAQALLASDDRAFLAALQAAFGRRLQFVGTGPRASFPLALRLRERLVRPREVWIGNSAQTLHPVSGQGFNLGIRDALVLAQTLLDGSSADPGDAARLACYARCRQSDRLGAAAFTDGIVRLFSNANGPLRLIRGLGLVALDVCPEARNFIARRMIWGARAW